MLTVSENNEIQISGYANKPIPLVLQRIFLAVRHFGSASQSVELVQPASVSRHTPRRRSMHFLGIWCVDTSGLGPELCIGPART